MSQGTACTLSLVSDEQEPDVKEKSANQIAIWLPGLEEESFTTLKSYLMGESNVFEHPAESAKLNANFPYLTHIISEIKCLKDGPFLPAEVSKVFLSMISLLEDFNAISYERAVKRTKPRSSSSHALQSVIRTTQNTPWKTDMKLTPKGTEKNVSRDNVFAGLYKKE